jgi:hypothetical protein
MKQPFRLLISLSVVLLCSSVASAQRAAAGAHGHAGISAHSHQVLSSGAVSRPVARRPAAANRRPLNGVPGLGFDYEHLAAVHREALERRYRHGVVYPLFWGGYPYPYDSDYDNGTYAPSTADQYPGPAGEPGDQDAYAQQPYETPLPAVQEPANATPEREIENFSLVLKDGSQISAVAFTRQGDQVVYITNEGKRQYVAVAKIDADATTKLNEDRGTPLRFSL